MLLVRSIASPSSSIFSKLVLRHHLRLSRSSLAAMSTSAATSRPVVLCGPSGVGKSTLIAKLFKDHPEFGFSVSHTTRQPRVGEKDGISYHFVDQQQFDALVKEGAFLEHAVFGSNSYGTTARAVRDIQQGKKEGTSRALLDIDTQGVIQIKERHADLNALFVFIAPPSIASLRTRLEGRGTETPDSLARRLAAAGSELAYARAGGHNVIIVNDDVDRAYQKLKQVVEGESVESDQLPAEEEDEQNYRLAQQAEK